MDGLERCLSALSSARIVDFGGAADRQLLRANPGAILLLFRSAGVVRSRRPVTGAVSVWRTAYSSVPEGKDSGTYFLAKPRKNFVEGTPATILPTPRTWPRPRCSAPRAADLARALPALNLASEDLAALAGEVQRINARRVDAEERVAYAWPAAVSGPPA